MRKGKTLLRNNENLAFCLALSAVENPAGAAQCICLCLDIPGGNAYCGYTAAGTAMEKLLQ